MGCGCYSFFKVILSFEEMQIPPAFVPKIRRALVQGIVQLRDGYGNLWEMGVARTSGDKWYFRKEDLAQFCEDNSLEIGDFVVFYYKGNNLFDFVLLGRNGCGKKGVGALKLKVNEEEVDDGQEHDEHDDDCVQEEESEEHDDDDDVQEDESEEHEDDDDYVEEEEEHEEDENVRSFSKKVKAKSKSKSSCPLEKNSSKDRAFGTESMPGKRSFQKKKKIPDCYGADIFESGLAPLPKNPFFVSRSRLSTRKNELYIPKDVVVDHNLKIPEKVLLVDEQGRKWETKMKKWKDGRLWCTRGWRNLCNVNSIGKDDTCICEFVQDQKGNKNVLRILVHVLDK